MFTEQGSSAPQMTAAKVMDIISRLPGCSRQAADAVSAKTQVKMENASTLFKISKSECPDIWIRPPTTQMAKIMVQNRRPNRSSRQESVRSSFGKTVMEKAIFENPTGARLGRRLHWECSYVNRARGLFLSVYEDDIKLASKTQHKKPDVENSHGRR